MLLIVGLGNPGKEYQSSRHNIGFVVLDRLSRHWEEDKDNQIRAFERDCEENKEFQAREYELDIDIEEKCFHLHVGLLKPLTFMNKSGEVVIKVVRRLEKRGFKIKRDLFVVHDDWDIPFGQVKLQFGMGSARHKGVESIFDHLKTQEFHRLRIGISRPFYVEDSKDYVLSKFSSGEKRSLQEIKEKAVEKVQDWIIQAVKKGARDGH